MATDRFIYFDKFPDRHAFWGIVNGYIGDGPASLTEDKTGEMVQCTISIPGTPSDECDWFTRLPGESTPFKPRQRNPDFEVATRWIEVVLDDRVRCENVCPITIDVITHSQDPFICAIADGLQKVLARRLGGRINVE